MKNVLVMILAGGKGERLHPLTLHRAKPAVPFAGTYRIVDFTLSNCINSNLRQIAVLVQYKSLSLNRHLKQGWDILSTDLGEFVISVPPEQRIGDTFYRGTADAIYQNVYMIEKSMPEFTLILAGDHVYKMDYGELVRHHLARAADVTVSAVEAPCAAAAGQLGVLEIDGEGRIVGFEEKPARPKPMPGSTDVCLASMGIYLFRTDTLVRTLTEAAVRDLGFDFGRHILPGIIGDFRVFAYNFTDENAREPPYWRDVGTIDSYWEANMGIAAVEPPLDLYDRDWPIRTFQPQAPPAKFVFAQEEPGGRLGTAMDSIVSSGCILSGGRVQNSVLSPYVRVNSFSEVVESILLENVQIGRHSRIRRAIIDKDVVIPPGTEIGWDLPRDRERFHVSESGIVVIPKGAEI